MKSLKKYEYIKIISIKGIPVYFYWLLNILLLLIGVTAIINQSIPIGLVALLFILVVHELGHAWFASRLGLNTYLIKIYPWGGVCTYESSRIEYNNNIVAWGGVVAQAIIFIPALLIMYFFGDLMSENMNELLLYLGKYNAIIALVNLIPIKPLDGASCWRTVPLFFKYGRIQKKTKLKKRNLENYDKWRK